MPTEKHFLASAPKNIITLKVKYLPGGSAREPGVSRSLIRLLKGLIRPLRAQKALTGLVRPLEVFSLRDLKEPLPY